MARKPTKTRAKALTVSALTPAVIPGTDVVPEAAYRNDHHPIGSGPWKGEPDKFAWTDKATGYPCVVVREYTGEYGAHVGVPPSHSLSGYKAKAVPGEISEGLHRPISSAEPCQRSAPEPVSICHISARIAHGQRMAAINPPQEDDAWWLGMTFDGPRDLVPAGGKRKLAAERGETYRDAKFAFEQATLLARNLFDWEIGVSSDAKLDAGPSGLPRPDKEGSR